MLTGQHNQYSDTINLVAQSTLRQDPHPGSQQAGTINTPLEHCGQVNTAAQSSFRHNHHFGTITILAQHCSRVSPLAQSTVRHNQPFGTFIIPAQSTFWHNQQFGIIIIVAHAAGSILTCRYTTA